MNDLKNLKALLNSMIPGEPVPDDVWETRDGRRIPIVAMTDTHLVNTLLYLKRRACESVVVERYREFLPESCKDKFIKMEFEAIKRGFHDWESRFPIRDR